MRSRSLLGNGMLNTFTWLDTRVYLATNMLETLEKLLEAVPSVRFVVKLHVRV
jgi:hypothetical protein